MGTSQHRRVFVGNIPYDATEEQLVQICEEVGPVVSFRLVLDRETGKPKGYGFCEYKDEETALSARRNLMGYEINGRQLRVDFAENDKGADRNREQGRGGPGLVTNADTKKQSRGHGDSSLQPIGVPVAVAAASVMEGTLGGAQAGAVSAQIRLSNQSGLDSDPLTLHLAKMSRNQLSEIMSALKGMATQNKELARRLLLSNPQLLKALFQTEIMLQMVSPQALQMPNACHASSTLSQSLIQEVPQLDQTLSRLPSTSQKSLQAGLMPKVQAGQMPVVSQNSLLPSQFPALPQTPSQLQQLGNNNQLLQPASLPVHSINSKTLGHLPVRAQSQMVISSSLQPKMQLPLIQQVTTRAGGTDAGYNNQMLTSNALGQPSCLRPPMLQEGNFKPLTTASGVPLRVKKDVDGSALVSEAANRPSKLVKLDGGKVKVPSVPASGPSRALRSGLLPAGQSMAIDDVQHPGKQLQLPPEVEAALLQQVMNLTPEQLGSLPPEQQQQVVQLQQILK